MTAVSAAGDAFTRRKRLEADLLGASEPTHSSKLQAAAELQAAFLKSRWNCAETGSSDRTFTSGPYTFHFDYQRADLDVEGPLPYPSLPKRLVCRKPVYTNGGMAAIAAVLAFIRHMEMKVSLPIGCYAETRELASYLDVIGDGLSFFDSTAPKLSCDLLRHDTVVVDTSCWDASSKRLSRILEGDGQRFVLVRSHHKLDMLGTEYGRLGSIAVVAPPDDIVADELTETLRENARLFGLAARPDDFFPLVGDETRWLTRSRTANIIRNCRALTRMLSASDVPILCFQHNLYVDLLLPPKLDREGAAGLAGQLAEIVGRKMRHAGSFGFDFTATEWTDHPIEHGTTALRIAPGDQSACEFADVASSVCAAIKELLPVETRRAR